MWERNWRAALAVLDVQGTLDWSMAVLDGSFVPAKTGGECVGLTRKGKGTKWMRVVDGNGLPLGVHLDSVNRAEVRLAQQTLDTINVARARGRPKQRPEKLSWWRTVAAWCRSRLGCSLSRQTGWRYLRRLGARWRKPRPHHVQANPAAQADFTAHVRPLLRPVALAFPQATVERWAMDEHRISLTPLLRTAWTSDRLRPLAPVQHRFAWRYLVGFVHPASGRTSFHLATSVSIARFEVQLAAFARQVRAGPTKQIVLVLDRAGRHTRVRLRVPKHVHLLFCSSCPPLRRNCSPQRMCGP